MRSFDAARRVFDAAMVQKTTALRIGLSFVLPLTIGALAGHVAYGAIATQGAFVATYARDEPYRRRLRVMLGAAVALTLAVSLGTLTSGSPVAMALGAGVVASAAALAGLTWQVGPPREFMIVLAYLAATTYPGGIDEIPLRIALVLGGALLVTAIAMAGRLRWPRGPEEQAVSRAYLAMARLLDALGNRDIGAARHQALFAMDEARSVLARADHRPDLSDRLTAIAVAGEAVMDTSLGLALRNEGPIDPAWARALRTIAASIRQPDRARGLSLPANPPPAHHGPRFARAMDSARQAADPQMRLDATMVPFGRRRPRRRGSVWRRALRPGSVAVATAARSGVAVGVATGVGLLIGLDHGVWVGLTAAAVLQASNVGLTGQRTVQRAIGTVLGVGLASAILLGTSEIAVLIVALAVCQTINQATARIAYGFAVVFATPIALMIVEIGQPGTPADSLLRERVIDTLLGCLIGFAARRFLWPRTAATQLPQAQGAAIEAVHDVLIAALTRADAPSSSLVRRTRRRLHAALLELRTVHEDAIGDLVWSTAAADARWPTTAAVQRLAYAAMAVPAPADVPPDREMVARLDRALTVLAAVAQGHRVAQGVLIPRLPGLPVTQRALIGLRDALAEAQVAGVDGPAERTRTSARPEPVPASGDRPGATERPDARR